MLDIILKTFFVKVQIGNKRKSFTLIRNNDSRNLVDIKTKTPEEKTVLSGYFSHIKGLAVRETNDRLCERNRQLS